MEQLDELISKLMKYKWASDYHTYLENRRKGLKEQAKQALRKFITTLSDIKAEDKRDFIDTVFTIAFITDDYSLYLPNNLYSEHFIPIIKKWINAEPDNHIPYRWSNNFENIRKAVTLNQNDQISLTIFLNRLINKVSMNQHEIAEGFSYDGDVSDDIKLISFSESFIDNVADVDKRNEIKKCLSDLKKTAIAYKASH